MTYPELNPSDEAFDPSQCFQGVPLLSESVIYETESEDHGHRIKIGSQTLALPPSAEVDVQVSKDGSGVVGVVIPAKSVRVIPAGKRVVKSRKRDRENKETQEEAIKTDANSK